MKIEIGCASDPGRARERNEDTVGVFAEPEGGRRRNPPPLFVVADGMGGHKAGETASTLAVETIEQVYREMANSTPPAALLRQAIQEANRVIRAQAATERRFEGMGTTVVAALVTPEQIIFANVGDSRGYLIHDGNFRQVTLDHSLAAESERRGLSPDQVELIKRNVITRAAGRRDDVDVDTFDVSWQPGDGFLLCTDGLWGLVSEAQMEAVLAELDPQQAADKLIDMALIARAPDNVSVIVVRRVK